MTVSLVVIVYLSRKAARLQNPRPATPLKREEREQVQHYRELWNLHGHHPVELMRSTFNVAEVSLVGEWRWLRDLLNRPHSELEQAMRKFSEAVAMNGASVGVKETGNRFVAMWAAHSTVAWYLYVLEQNQQIKMDAGQYSAAMASWKARDKEFREKTRGMMQRPEFAKLPIVPMPNEFHTSESRNFWAWREGLPPIDGADAGATT